MPIILQIKDWAMTMPISARAVMALQQTFPCMAWLAQMHIRGCQLQEASLTLHA